MESLSFLDEENIIPINNKIYLQNEDDKVIFEMSLKKVNFSEIPFYFNFSKKRIIECKYYKRYSKNFNYIYIYIYIRITDYYRRWKSN